MKSLRVGFFVLVLLLSSLSLAKWYVCSAYASGGGAIVLIDINGSINPATDDFLETSVKAAEAQGAKLFVVRLNTPGGLITSMQSMVQSLLEARVPTVVYVSPRGAGAMSAGVFITLAGHFAVMAPGTNIGAAHPVMAGGQDVTGDMREKVENAAVALIRGIAEQRGRNVKWAEEAVRESVAITDREALEEKVIDFIAGDLASLLAELEGKTVEVAGNPVTLSGVSSAPQVVLDMSLKQRVANILSDPNIAILLGLGALLGIGIELYHPGAILPGVCGAICLVLSLVSSQIIPINIGGVALLLLGAVFLGIELFIPSFGIWGGAGIVCLVLGSIYFVDTDMVWGIEGFEVDRLLVGSIAAVVGLCLMLVGYLALKSAKQRVVTGKEGIVGKKGKTVSAFAKQEGTANWVGKVYVMGEIWSARCVGQELAEGQKVVVDKLEEGMVLLVRE